MRVCQIDGLGGCTLDPGYTDVERNDRPAVATLFLTLRLCLPNQRHGSGRMTGVFGGCTGRRNHDSALLLPRRHATKVGSMSSIESLGSAPLSAHPPMMTSRLRNRHQWRGQVSIRRHRPFGMMEVWADTLMNSRPLGCLSTKPLRHPPHPLLFLCKVRRVDLQSPSDQAEVHCLSPLLWQSGYGFGLLPSRRTADS